jgi:hypothetical protein
LRCALETWATAVSIGLQHGIPLETYLEKARHTSFEPAGRPSFPVITPSLGAVLRDVPKEAVVVEPEADDRKVAKSVVDYIARFLERRFPSR